MILQALADYYDFLVKEYPSEMPVYGWDRAKIEYLIDLDSSGQFRILPLGQEMLVPKQYGLTSGYNASFLCNEANYMLGADIKKTKQQAVGAFLNAKDKHLKILQDCSGREATVIKTFFERWDPEKAEENEYVQNYLPAWKNKKKKCMTFSINGQVLFEVPEIVEAWNNYYAEDVAEVEEICVLTGRRTSVAKVHPNIQGLRGAQANSKLVSFNFEAVCSYGKNAKQQGLNAPVSDLLAFKSVAACNYLLKHNSFYSENMLTSIAWSDNAEAVDILAGMTDDRKSEISNENIKTIMDNLSRGNPAEIDGFTVDGDTSFSILGLLPNSSRDGVAYYYKKNFAHFMRRAKQYQEEVSICGTPQGKEIIPLYKVIDQSYKPFGECISKESFKKKWGRLYETLYHSMIAGSMYSPAIYQAVITAIFKAVLKDKNVGYVRAGFLKAFLLRNYASRWGDKIKMSLNEDCRETAYVLGRIFAVVEKIQWCTDKEGKINLPIRAKYFNSFCMTPGVIFPALQKSADIYLKKLVAKKETKSTGIALSKMLTSLMDKIEVPATGTPIPKFFLQDEKGAFILGYHQQREYFFMEAKKNKIDDEAKEEEDLSDA